MNIVIPGTRTERLTIKVMVSEFGEKLRTRASEHLHVIEAGLYIGVGVLLAAAAIAVLYDSGLALWRGIGNRSLTDYALLVLDQLLFILVLVELLHTVRISIRSQEIVIEPFLIVGLIASVRRVLVTTMQAAKLNEEGHGAIAEEAFRNSMLELVVLGFLVLVFIASTYCLRHASSRHKIVKE
jgi:uncharacterized membrane protein (DUF373 family)